MSVVFSVRLFDDKDIGEEDPNNIEDIFLVLVVRL
jgi:hypothetical protein